MDNDTIFGNLPPPPSAQAPAWEMLPKNGPYPQDFINLWNSAGGVATPEQQQKLIDKRRFYDVMSWNQDLQHLSPEAKDLIFNRPAYGEGEPQSFLPQTRDTGVASKPPPGLAPPPKLNLGGPQITETAPNLSSDDQVVLQLRLNALLNQPMKMPAIRTRP
jgi:hypothetical protein